jgi:hypothetical protein
LGQYRRRSSASGPAALLVCHAADFSPGRRLLKAVSGLGLLLKILSFLDQTW